MTPSDFCRWLTGVLDAVRLNDEAGLDMSGFVEFLGGKLKTVVLEPVKSQPVFRVIDPPIRTRPLTPAAPATPSPPPAWVPDPQAPDRKWEPPTPVCGDLGHE